MSSILVQDSNKKNIQQVIVGKQTYVQIYARAQERSFERN